MGPCSHSRFPLRKPEYKFWFSQEYRPHDFPTIIVDGRWLPDRPLGRRIQYSDKTTKVPKLLCARPRGSVCLSVVIPFIFGQTRGRTSRGYSGFLHLPSAVLALNFLARRIQPSLSLVDREVGFCVYPRINRSPLVGHDFFFFFLLFS